MSAEEAVADTLQKPVDQNAQAAEDAKRLLEELQGETAAKKEPKAVAKETNGSSDSKEVDEKSTTEAKEGDSEPKKEWGRSTDRDRNHRDRGQNNGRGRGRGRGGQNGHGTRSGRNNIKSDLTTQEETNDPVAIRKQLHFYFSDSNLPYDNFLWKETGGKDNKPFPLETLHKFKRMRHFQPFEAIVDAVRESDFLELAEDDTCVRRKQAYDPDNVKVVRGPAESRSIYVKGFGEEVASTQFDIEAFFAPYGPTNAVRLRRTDDKLFKGSVFVEFETEELANAFLELDPKPKFQDKDLKVLSKKDYVDGKADDIKAGKIKPNHRFDKKGRDDRGGRDNKRKRDEEDTRDWRTRRDEDRKRGFRDDKRGGRRDRDSRGKFGRDNGPEVDDRGIPVVKTTKRDSGRDDALAQARAAVEADKKKDDQKSTDDVDPTENGKAEIGAADGVKADTEATAGKKRVRDDDDDEAEDRREIKKLDSKSENVAVNGS